jgi:hypothetical protein
MLRISTHILALVLTKLLTSFPAYATLCSLEDTQMDTRTEQHGNVEVGIIAYEGREYAALGSVIEGERIAAYLGKNGQLTKWDGTVIGTYRVTSTWRTPRSYVSSTQSQVYAIVNGRKYTGRSAGEGMLFRGKQVKA